MTLAKVRTILGYVLMVTGTAMLAAGLINHKTLWAGYKTKEVVIAKANPVENLPKDEHQSGEVKVSLRYEWTTNHLPSGEYQVIDSDNRMWPIKFCEPVPNISMGSIVDIRYKDSQKDEDCIHFINAKMIRDGG